MITMILTECMFYILGLDNPQLLSTSPTVPIPRVGSQSSSSSLPITPTLPTPRVGPRSPSSSDISDIYSGEFIIFKLLHI